MGNQGVEIIFEGRLTEIYEIWCQDGRKKGSLAVEKQFLSSWSCRKGGEIRPIQEDYGDLKRVEPPEKDYSGVDRNAVCLGAEK